MKKLEETSGRTTDGQTCNTGRCVYKKDPGHDKITVWKYWMAELLTLKNMNMLIVVQPQ